MKIRIEITGPVASGKTTAYCAMLQGLRIAGWIPKMDSQVQGITQWSRGAVTEVFEFETERNQ